MFVKTLTKIKFRIMYNFWEKHRILDSQYFYRLKRLRVRSRHYSSTYGLFFKKFNYCSNKFLYGRVSKRAHNNLGHYTVFSVGRRKKAKFLNYISNTSYSVFSYYAMPVCVLRDRQNIKFGMLLINCIGERVCVPYTTHMQLFSLLYGTFSGKYLKLWPRANKYFYFFDMLLYLPFYTTISYYSDCVNGRIKYSKAVGSSSVIWTKSVVTERGPLIMILMASGEYKLLSANICAFQGNVEALAKRKFINTRAGYWRRIGIKPTVRGVAKNPVDHPHGGREKTVLCPVTPWGKVTKLK